jgi:endonuclease/exonuclease/phosphatase family metal-dependent hydrolase
LRSLRPDVAVLQECARPPHEDSAAVWFGSNPRQGIAVVVKQPLQVVAVPSRDRTASMFAASVSGPSSFTVLATWAQREPTYSEALRRGLQVYRDILLAAPCVLMGDLNSSTAWDDRYGRTDHRRLEAQLHDEFGLVSAYHAATGEPPGQESRPTHFWRWQAGAPFHLDYCYLPKEWLHGLETVTVGSYQDWADVSDHRPVCVDVSPPPEAARASL